jgi:hypothetical protein
VVLESVLPLDDGFECLVRSSDGTPNEAILSWDEAATVFGQQAEALTSVKPADPENIRLLVEFARSLTSVTNIEGGRQKSLLHTYWELASALAVEPTTLLPGAWRTRPLAEPGMNGKTSWRRACRRARRGGIRT